MTDRCRVGTRRSPLARAQTALVLRALARAAPAARFEEVGVSTSGDRDRSPGGSPDFTDAIDRALLDGKIDLAVHSAKDLPARLDRRFRIVALLRRANPRDCLVARRLTPGSPLPRGARVGSSSPRRRAQLLRYRPDLEVVEIRGNVDTRIGLVRSGVVDAALLAVAGVVRLGRSTEIARVLPTSSFLPAPAQGALAVVARAGDAPLVDALRTLDHAATRAAVTAERSFAAALGSDCRLPLAALATVRGRTLTLTGELLDRDGRRSLRRTQRGPAAHPEQLGTALGRALRSAGVLRWAVRDGR